MGDEQIKVYANTLIDRLIFIKDRHKDIFNLMEIDTINDACNLIAHNIEKLEKT